MLHHYDLLTRMESSWMPETLFRPRDSGVFETRAKVEMS